MTNNNLFSKNSINTFLNNYFNLFVVVLLTILLLLSYFLILQPKLTATTLAISENTNFQQKMLQAEKLKLVSLESAVANYNTIDPIDLERVNRILPNSYDKELLYGELEELIIRNGFTPTSIRLEKEGEESKGGASSPEASVKGAAAGGSSKIGTININLDIASVDYARLKNLLNILENNLRLLDVKRLGVAGDSSGNLELTTYYYKK